MLVIETSITPVFDKIRFRVQHVRFFSDAIRVVCESAPALSILLLFGISKREWKILYFIDCLSNTRRLLGLHKSDRTRGGFALALQISHTRATGPRSTPILLTVKRLFYSLEYIQCPKVLSGILLAIPVQENHIPTDKARFNYRKAKPFSRHQHWL